MAGRGELVSLAAERERRAQRAPSRDEYRGALFEWRELAETLPPGDLVAAVDYLRAGGLSVGGLPRGGGAGGPPSQHVGLEVQFVHRERGQGRQGRE